MGQIIYAIAYLVGEKVRDFLYGEPVQEGEEVPEEERIPGDPRRKQGKKFVLLQQKWSIRVEEWERLMAAVWEIFLAIVLPVPACS